VGRGVTTRSPCLCHVVLLHCYDCFAMIALAISRCIIRSVVHVTTTASAQPHLIPTPALLLQQPGAPVSLLHSSFYLLVSIHLVFLCVSEYAARGCVTVTLTSHLQQQSGVDAMRKNISLMEKCVSLWLVAREAARPTAACRSSVPTSRHHCPALSTFCIHRSPA